MGIADDRQLPGDSQERTDAAIATAGALLSPEDVIDDYGDFNGDYATSSRDDVSASTREETESFYDSHRQEDIKIK